MNNKNFWETGKELLKNGAREEALESFTEGHKSGDAKATFGLALMHYHGWAVDEDKERASELFESCSKELHRLAAMDEDREAAFILYRCYDTLSTERFIEPDDDKALEWLELSADFHYMDAMYWLGIAYMGGTILPVEYDEWEAKELFEECALIGGMPEAMIELGNICYWNSELDAAKEWYEKALEAGEDGAKQRLEKLAKGEDPTEE